jgi:hypothetical protein
MHSAISFVVLLVFLEESQVGWVLLLRLCRMKKMKGEQGEKVFYFDVVLLFDSLSGCCLIEVALCIVQLILLCC